MTLLCVLVLMVAATATANEEEHEHGHFKKNEVALFMGGTTPFDEVAGGHAGWTVGLEYERRLNPDIGLMAFAEYVSEKHKREDLVAVMATWRWRHLRVGAGPGLELVEKDKSDGGTENKSFFVVALRGSYPFHIRSVSLAPTLGFDFIGETKNNLVFGVSVGYGF